MAVAAGAPLLPKLAAAANGSGVEVNPWDIASSLLFLMLLPLGIGLLVQVRYEDASSANPPAARRR